MLAATVIMLNNKPSDDVTWKVASFVLVAVIFLSIALFGAALYFSTKKK